MGFSSSTPGVSDASMAHGGGVTGDEQTHAKGPSFGSQLLSSIPGASLIAPPNPNPIAPHADAVGNDMIAANAKPPEGGGLSAILKLIAGI